MSNIDLLLSQAAYKARARVKSDILNLSHRFASLNPTSGSLMHNNGVEVKLAVLSGTVPIKFHNVQYNVPVEVYIPEAYPDSPPICYVRPTANMSVKANHKNVDREGLCYLPYLHDWRANTSNLVDLCSSLSNTFSQEPPLFTKPAQALPVQQPPRPPVQQHSSMHAAYASRNGYTTPTTAANSYASPAPVSYGPPGYQVATPGVATAAGVVASTLVPNNRQDLERHVTAKLRDELKVTLVNMAAEVDHENENVQLLKTSEDGITTQMAQLQMINDMMGKTVGDIDQKTVDIEVWAEGMKASASEETPEEEDGLESKLEPYDELSAQIIKLHGEYHALDDTFYYLDRALAAGESKLDVTVYLKETRKLARELFLKKAHLKKIKEVVGAELHTSQTHSQHEQQRLQR